MNSTTKRKVKGGSLLKRTAGKNPPKTRSSLTSFGSEKVSSFKLMRTPLPYRTIINALTGNKLESALKNAKVDEVFHLYAIVNGKYTVEKNNTVKLFKGIPSTTSQTESLDVPVTKDFTIQEMMDNTLKKMGPEAYSSYDLRTNNCSVFLSNLLIANGISNAQAQAFVKQPAGQILNDIPSVFEKIAKVFTEADHIASKLVEGEGQKKKKKTLRINK